MIGTNNALAIKTVEAGRDLPHDIEAKVQAIDTVRRAEPPNCANADAANVRNLLHGRRAIPQPGENVCNGLVHLGHDQAIIHKSEFRKRPFRERQRAFRKLNGYGSGMSMSELIKRRLAIVLADRKQTQKGFAEDIGRSEAWLSNALNGKIDKDGKNRVPSLSSLMIICEALDLPVWAMLHDDDGVFALYANKDARLKDLHFGSVASDMAACMAILSESRSTAAEGLEQSLPRTAKRRKKA